MFHVEQRGWRPAAEGRRLSAIRRQRQLSPFHVEQRGIRQNPAENPGNFRHCLK
jgi:hypothetical protein